jgi:hypothetical protein
MVRGIFVVLKVTLQIRTLNRRRSTTCSRRPPTLPEDLQLSRNVLVYRVGTQLWLSAAVTISPFPPVSAQKHILCGLRIPAHRHRWFQKSHLAIQPPAKRSNPTSPRLSGPAAMRHIPAPQEGHNFCNGSGRFWSRVTDRCSVCFDSPPPTQQLLHPSGSPARRPKKQDDPQSLSPQETSTGVGGYQRRHSLYSLTLAV